MSTRKIILFFTCIVLLALTGLLFVNFLEYHQEKINAGGIVFDDPVLGLLPREDLSHFIFGITYGCILLYLLSRVRKPMEIAKFALAASIMPLLRMMTMTLLPLEEPTDLVSLTDPVLYGVIFSNEITADLFFSGHTAFVFTMFFLSKKKIYLVLGSILGILLMVQRVHFSIDILAAIPFSYLIARVVDFTFKKSRVE